MQQESIRSLPGLTRSPPGVQQDPWWSVNYSSKLSRHNISQSQPHLLYILYPPRSTAGHHSQHISQGYRVCLTILSGHSKNRWNLFLAKPCYDCSLLRRVYATLAATLAMPCHAFIKINLEHYQRTLYTLTMSEPHFPSQIPVLLAANTVITSNSPLRSGMSQLSFEMSAQY